MSFSELLKNQLIEESKNYYTDNYDYYSHPRKKPVIKRVINFGKRILYQEHIFRSLFKSDFLYIKIFLHIYKMDKYLPGLNFFYNALSDDESKKLLLKIVAFRILGYSKVKLPLSSPQYWLGLKEIEKTVVPDDILDNKLRRHNLPGLSIYMHSKPLYTTFTLEQYRHPAGIGAEMDDVVFDLGACYGDTALYFAELVGLNGKVYAFEFIPGNIKVINKNLELNPVLAQRIEIVNNPVWISSDDEVFFKDKGSSSKVSFQKFDGYDGIARTITIDDFIESKNISKVDFIKTDIEGAEPYALKGAEKTLRRFKPKLAISVYHSMNDFVGIVKQIDELSLGYKFFLGHFTIFGSETVLFCVA